MRRPGLQQGAIHGEMLVAEQRLDLRCAHQLLQELPQGPPAHSASLRKHPVIEEPLPVLGECGGVPDRIVGTQADKPAEQQVVVELLQQKPLRSDPVERLQQRGQQHLLGRN